MKCLLKANVVASVLLVDIPAGYQSVSDCGEDAAQCITGDAKNHLSAPLHTEGMLWPSVLGYSRCPIAYANIHGNSHVQKRGTRRSRSMHTHPIKLEELCDKHLGFRVSYYRVKSVGSH